VIVMAHWLDSRLRRATPASRFFGWACHNGPNALPPLNPDAYFDGLTDTQWSISALS